MTPSELNQVKQYLQGLQSSIIEGIGQFESKPFLNDSWERAEGGGGCSRVLEEGSLLERGGVNFSHVMGDKLPGSATASRQGLAGASFEAMGVSLVFHPRNPYVPTVHMNVRLFAATTVEGESVWWFGGVLVIVSVLVVAVAIRCGGGLCGWLGGWVVGLGR